MRTIEVSVFTVNELSEEAREQAHMDYIKDGDNYGWHSENKESLEAFAKLFPIKIKHWEYDENGGEVRYGFHDEWHHDVDDVAHLSGPRLAAWLWNNLRGDIYKGRWYSKSFNRKTNTLTPGVGRVERRSRITLETGGVLTGYCIDDSLLEPIYAYMKKPDPSVTLEDLLDTCFEEWAKDCAADLEHANSMEAFIEACEANNYEFEADGTMI
ncbi:hypothetical protein [Spirosoma sordidisoli]|uniref:Uncharacterized protein n=1 Tax=Spirosoma sordidisoli TaxID=2502893 RepID=A0A4Q2UJD3_9BACT|nr:hypothetical protein [Spirosoma sordidisoli]RYC69593.1 hypothetical protein EQG79_13400 [Spirosoma sordidisoli]